MKLNFITFTTKYKLVNRKLVAQVENAILRVFPVYSSNNKGQNFSLYCKYQLIRYKPWQRTQDDACGDQPGTDEIYISQWKQFLETSYAKEHVPDWHEKLDTVQNYKEDNIETEHTCTTQQLPQREEWVLLADLVPESVLTDNQSPQTDFAHYNWQRDRLKYRESQIRGMSSWIKTNKDACTSGAIAEQTIVVSRFSDMQKHAFNIIKAHSEQPYPKNPLYLTIIGGGGKGKSYLINAIKSLPQLSCAVTAKTGKAAYAIHGCTIHSLLKLPIGRKGNKDLTGQSC